MHMIAPGPLESTCWRQFMALWGDCKKISNSAFECDYYYYYYYALTVWPYRARTLALCLRAVCSTTRFFTSSHVCIACLLHQSIKRMMHCKWIEMRNSWGPSLLASSRCNTKPWRANQRWDNPWLAKGKKSDWPSVLSLARAIFHI